MGWDEQRHRCSWEHCRCCDKLWISKEPQQRSRNQKHIFRDASRDACLTFIEELRRAMFSSLDKIAMEIEERFKRLREVNDKFECVMLAKLLDPWYVLNMKKINDDIDQNEFVVERERLQNFITVSGDRRKVEKEGPLGLLKFIQKVSLGISVLNIVIMLRIYVRYTKQCVYHLS